MQKKEVTHKTHKKGSKIRANRFDILVCNFLFLTFNYSFALRLRYLKEKKTEFASKHLSDKKKEELKTLVSFLFFA